MFKWLVFKIRDGYKLELQSPETMKLFSSTENNRQNKKWRKFLSPEIVEVVLVQCNF